MNNQNTVLAKISKPNWVNYLSYFLSIIFILVTCALVFLPWVQTSKGFGRVIAFDPNDRIQSINATVEGRLSKWFVKDGEFVTKGAPIVEIIDNDPDFISRLELERDAANKKYLAYQEASKTSKLNFERQKKLFEQGLSSRTKFEKAQIDYQKLVTEEASAATSLAKAEVQLSRQKQQLILAPRDGYILNIKVGSGFVQVKRNQKLATFIPNVKSDAVEVYLDGNDLPLVQVGQRARLQFEGWPAVQFSGWPSVAIGTFGGVIAATDPSVSDTGKFRAIIVPDENNDWPETSFLRQGSRVISWVMINQVKLGYEIWRKINDFPISLDTNKVKAGDKEYLRQDYE